MNTSLHCDLPAPPPPPRLLSPLHTCLMCHLWFHAGRCNWQVLAQQPLRVKTSSRRRARLSLRVVSLESTVERRGASVLTDAINAARGTAGEWVANRILPIRQITPTPSHIPSSSHPCPFFFLSLRRTLVCRKSCTPEGIRAAPTNMRSQGVSVWYRLLTPLGSTPPFQLVKKGQSIDQCSHAHTHAHTLTPEWLTALEASIE